MKHSTTAPKRRVFNRKEEIYATCFALIPLIGFVLFSLFPTLLAFVTMFTSMQGYRFSTMKWNSFANFEQAFTDTRFLKSLGVTAYVSTAHLIGLIVALATAAVLSQKVRGANAFTVLFFVPYICSSVASSIMWRQMFDYNSGIINEVLKFLGSENGINWTYDPKAFTPMLIAVIAWQAPGYGIVLYKAALTGVKESLYEAAKIDGAGRWKCFTAITLPSISPTTYFLLMMGIIAGMQTFDVARIFTADIPGMEGGPEDMGLTTVLYIYLRGITYRDMPVASVMSFALFFIVLGLTLLNQKMSKKWVNYD